MDSIDQERERIESREVANRGKGAYGDFIEIPNKDTISQGTGQKSYIDQKREEYAKYLAEQNQAPQYQPAQNYSDEMEDYYNQELRKQQMEYELAQEMSKINKENVGSYEPDNYYQDNYGDYKAYQPQVASTKPKDKIAAGGKLIRKDSEDVKLALNNYQDSELKELNRNKGFGSYETSSKAYGNQNIEKTGKLEIIFL